MVTQDQRGNMVEQDVQNQTPDHVTIDVHTK